MDKLVSKVYEYIKKNNLIKGGDRIVAGVSGGADSVALLLLLLELKPLIGFGVYAVHVEHGIRGEASKSDEQYVRDLCSLNKVELKVFNIDAVSYSKDNKLTLEEAARIMRYDAFRTMCKEIHANKIAVAHHMDDQAETVLFNMVRGSGITGMSGIRPVNGDIIRPLLCLRKAELLEYLGNKGVSFCIDSTNEDVTYSRNRIRNNIIPELGELVSMAVEHISREADELAQINDCISAIGDNVYSECVQTRRRSGRFEYAVDIEKLSKYHIVFMRYVVKTIIWKLEKRWKDIGFVNVEDVLSLINKQSGRSLDLPRNLKCIRIQDELILYKNEENDADYLAENKGDFLANNKAESSAENDVILLEDNMNISVGDMTMTTRVFELEGDAKIPTDTYTKWFDYDKIKGNACLRYRRPGDYLVIDEKGNTQNYKKYCISAKIPLDMRYSIPLIACEKEIIWVVGYRMGCSNRITDNTKKVMEIKFTGGTCNE